MNKGSPRFRFVASAVLLTFLTLLVPALRNGDARSYTLAFAAAGSLLLCMLILPRLFSMDRFVFSLSVCLGMLPVTAMAYIGPDQGMSQGLLFLAGIILLPVGASVARLLTPSMLTGLSASFIGLLMLAAKLAGPGLSFTLNEAAVPVLLIACAAFISVRGGIPVLLPGTIGAVLLLLQAQPLAAFLWIVVFGVLLWSAGSRTAWALPLLLLLLFVLQRFTPLLFPASVEAESGPQGDSLSVLISGGLWGIQDAAEICSLRPSSLLYPLVSCYGLVFSGLMLALWLLLSLRGMFIASVARSRFHAHLAMGCSLYFALRTVTALLAAFSVFPFPLTDVPLLTSSPAELAAWFFALGLVCGISGRNEADLAEDAHLAMLAK